MRKGIGGEWEGIDNGSCSSVQVDWEGTFLVSEG
jgi:hypothetical protein